MILTGKEIINQIERCSIVIRPFSLDQVNPNSYNLRLNNELLIYNTFPLDPKRDNPTDKIIIPKEGYILNPGVLYLGRTLEYTETLDFVPILEGRSSIGRLGITIHVTAGFGDIGFKGYWTLEISTIHPVIIYPFINFCQIQYQLPMGETELYNSDKYQNNNDVQASKLYKEL